MRLVRRITDRPAPYIDRCRGRVEHINRLGADMH